MSYSTERLTSALSAHYRIERQLGQGGMATVYLANDLKHDRKVAIKVLKPELAAVIGGERFLVEIKTTAQLQHPHILPLFDSGTADGFLYYVMPYIEGETLRAKLDRETQLGIEEAVRLTTQVADALDYAHRHGVIHRDIKPENILLHDGRPMVADFGIALALSAAAGGRMTETGMSLGTPHYMSPEQATADKEITGRSDIYSLGSVLYEMLAGEPPHVGHSAQQIIMKIIAEEVQPVTRYRKAVPPHVAAAVAKALEKLPADRYATAAEFIRALTTASGGTRALPAPLARGERSYALTLLSAGSTVAALLFAILWWRARGTEDPMVVRFHIDLPASLLSGSVAVGTNVAISPDGRAIAYAAGTTSGVTRVYYRRLEEATALPIPGTEGAQTPAFSPDGRWIAYQIGNVIWKVETTGGLPVLVGPSDATPVGMAWTRTGEILVGARRGLLSIPATGGDPTVLAAPDSTRGELYFNQPRVLPDGETVLVAIQVIGGLTRSRIAAYSLSRRTLTRLDLLGFDPLGYLDGVLVYAGASGALTAVRIDLTNGRTSGPQVALGPTAVTTVAGASEAAISATGTLIYVPVNEDARLGWVDRRGRFDEILPEARSYAYPRLAPDGRQIAMAIGTGGRADVWVYDLASGTPTRMTAAGSYNDRPEWSANGRSVLFRSDRDLRTAIWQQPVDQSSPPVQLQSSPRHDYYEGVVSADGRYLLYQIDDAAVQQADVMYRALSGDTASRPFAASPSVESQPRFSPDGRWVAYVTDGSGTSQVVVRPFPGPGGQVQVSVDGGTEPVWDRNGRTLYYRDGRRMIAATVRTSPSFEVLRREALFPDDFAFAAAPHANYDVAPDGSRFLMIRNADGIKLAVVHGFRHELEARMRAAGGQ